MAVFEQMKEEMLTSLSKIQSAAANCFVMEEMQMHARWSLCGGLYCLFSHV